MYRGSVLSSSLRFFAEAQWDVVLLLLMMMDFPFLCLVATAYFPERTESRLSLPNVMRRTGLILVWCDLRVVGRLRCVITSVICRTILSLICCRKVYIIKEVDNVRYNCLVVVVQEGDFGDSGCCGVVVVLLLWRRCECFKCRVPGFWVF